MSEPLNTTASSQQPVSNFDPRVGDTLCNRYKIREFIEESDLATLYRGRDLATDQRVLIEILKTPVNNLADRFAAFAREYATLEQENILRFVDYEQSPSGQPCLISEFTDSVRLDNLIEAGGCIEKEIEVFDTAMQICQALKYAHEHGIVHGYLHPRNVFLNDEEDGTIGIKVANFGFSCVQQQLIANPEAEHPLAPNPQVDIYHLSILLYFIVTGELPGKATSLDEIISPFSERRVSFTTLGDHRPDLRGYEELVQLFDDTIDPDDAWRIKTVQEFEDGLVDWIESVKSAPAIQSTIAEKVAEDREKEREEEKQGFTSKKPSRKITNNMRYTIRQMVNLRTNQSNQEETAVMKLTNLASAKGPRVSPGASIARLTAAVLVLVASIGFLTYVILYQPEEVKQAWTVTSEKVAQLTAPNRKETVEEISFDSAPPAASVKSNNLSQTQLTQPPVDQKPRNKVEPFNHNILHDLYRGTFSPGNNQSRRRFRIEYREFNPEWLK